MKKPFDGFNRVLIDHEGTAVPMSRALKMGFNPDVGYMRGDGWSLGAPSELAESAYRLYADDWKYKIVKPETEWTPL